jgi:hypothetical protein
MLGVHFIVNLTLLSLPLLLVFPCQTQSRLGSDIILSFYTCLLLVYWPSGGRNDTQHNDRYTMTLSIIIGEMRHST